MDGYKDWIKQGFDDGVFLLVGSLQPNRSGGVPAHNLSLQALRNRVNQNPFVAEKVVNAQILEITPATADEQLAFLLT